MSGSIRRVATIVAASLFVSLSVSAATAQMKLNMPTRNKDTRTEEQKKADAEKRGNSTRGRTPANRPGRAP